MSTAEEPWTLQRLPLATRMVLAAFLLAAGVGYLTALVQVHFQHAAPGNLLPGPADLERTYGGGGPPASTMARLLENAEGPMNGTGTMRPAFFAKSQDWDRLTVTLPPEQFQKLLDQREGERLALLNWVRAGGPREDYDKDDHPLPLSFAVQEVTGEFLVQDANQKPIVPKHVKIRTLITQRCVVCHNPKGPEEHARLFPLINYERLQPYCQVKADRSLSLPRLAQTTHVHMLSFAMLFGLTGLIFSLTRYPHWVRCVVALWPLVAQTADIANWWLARSDALFAMAIGITGLLVGLGLAVQILGGLWDLFDRAGRYVVAGIVLALVATTAVVKLAVVDPYLHQERSQAQDQTH